MLYMARNLREMGARSLFSPSLPRHMTEQAGPNERTGCHVLALDLVRSWPFAKPSDTRTRPLVSHRLSTSPTSAHRILAHRRRSSILVDIQLPSEVHSRAPSPISSTSPARQEVTSLIKQAKKEAVSVPEFDASAFGF